jgi:hypothetical protein
MIRVAVGRGVLNVVTSVSRSVASASEYDLSPTYINVLHVCVRQMIRLHLSMYRALGYCMCYPWLLGRGWQDASYQLRTWTQRAWNPHRLSQSQAAGWLQRPPRVANLESQAPLEPPPNHYKGDLRTYTKLVEIIRPWERTLHIDS